MNSLEESVPHNQDVNMLCVEFATHVTVYQVSQHVKFHVCFYNFVEFQMEKTVHCIEIYQQLQIYVCVRLIYKEAKQ